MVVVDVDVDGYRLTLDRDAIVGVVLDPRVSTCLVLRGEPLEVPRPVAEAVRDAWLGAHKGSDE